MLWIAILLDVIITVLFVKIPYNHSSYSKLFGNPIFWILVAENIFIITHDVEKVFGRKAKDLVILREKPQQQVFGTCLHRILPLK
jgi:adenylate kinase